MIGVETCNAGNGIHQYGDFLGLSYNYTLGTVTLGKKTMDKLQLVEVPKKAKRRQYLETLKRNGKRIRTQRFYR